MTSARTVASELVRHVAEQDRRIRALAASPQLATSSIEDGALEEYDADGQIASIIGRQFDGTHTVATVTGPPPPTPAAPTAEAVPGVVTVRWSGKFEDDAVSPQDFKHVSVHLLALGEYADPSNQRATIRGELGDTATITAESGVYTVALMAWSLSGKHSEASETVEVDVPDMVDTEAITSRLDEADETIEGVRGELATTAATLSGRLSTAEGDLAASTERLTTAEGRVEEAFGAIATVDADAQAKADAAKQAAIDAAKADATAKADAAKSAATTAAAADAKSKADAAQAAALAAAKTYADAEAAGAGSAALAAAKADATTKADAAREAAKTAAAADAKAKADAAQAEAVRLAAIEAKRLADAAQAAAEAKAKTAQDAADSALTMAGTKSRVYYSTGNATGTATPGDVWRKVDASKNVIAEWYWDTAWRSSKVTTDMVSNLDVGKLTAGTGVIADLVAQKIAASTASFQTVDVAKLFATTATLSEAVINKLYADVVRSRKMSADLLLVGTDGNLIPNGGGERGAGVGWADRLIYDTADKPDGVTASFRCAPGSGAVQGSYDYVEVTPGREYLFEVWVKADKPNSRLYMEVRDQTGAHALTSSPVDDLPNGRPSSAYPIENVVVPTVWTKWTCSAVPKSGVERVRIAGMYFNHTSGTERGATVWLAGLSLRPRIADPALIATGAIIAPHITASEELTAKVASFLKVKAGMIDANAINGMTITGATVQTSGTANRGVKINNSGILAYDSSGKTTFAVDGYSGDVSITGSLYSGAAGTPSVMIDNDLWNGYKLPDKDGTMVTANGAGIRLGLSATQGVDIYYGNARNVDNSLIQSAVVRGPRTGNTSASINLTDMGHGWLASYDGERWRSGFYALPDGQAQVVSDDTAGVTRGLVITTATGEAMIQAINSSNKLRAAVTAYDDGTAQMVASDTSERTRAAVSVLGSGTTQMSSYDTAGKTKAAVGTLPDGSVMLTAPAGLYVNGIAAPKFAPGGTFRLDPIAPGDYAQATITFPAGYFTLPPAPLVTASNGYVHTVVFNVTPTSAVVRCWNFENSNVANNTITFAAVGV